MFIYNITIRIEWTIQPQWLTWMKETYIKQIMDSNCFTRHQLVRLLDIDEADGPTYALQLYAESREQYNQYIEQFLPHNERISYETWSSDILSFSTLMEVIE